jgi:glycosyltransferase involved in cell wall biosynthesis
VKIIRTATVALSLDLLLKGQLAFLDKKHEVIAVSGSDSHLDTVAQREKIRVINVPMQRAIRPLQDLLSLLRLYFVFKKEKPQLVHSITPKAGLLTMTAAWLAGVPIRIHTFTGLIFPYRKGFMFRLLRFMDQCVCRFSTHTIAEGKGVKDLLVTHKVTTKPIYILANGNVNGIDTDFFNPLHQSESATELRNSLSIPKDAFVFLFIGRLVSEKGIEELVTAFEHVQVKYPNSHLVVVGPMEPELDPIPSPILSTLENHQQIHLMGYQSNVRSYLLLSDVLVLPSYREGFPNVILQAGAMGLPCVVSDIPGCNEVIRNGENGLIVPPKDRNQLSLAMESMIVQKSAWYSKRDAIRETIVTQFTHAIVWEAVERFYQECEKNSHV